jgi:soluble P-type ATPase
LTLRRVDPPAQALDSWLDIVAGLLGAIDPTLHSFPTLQEDREMLSIDIPGFGPIRAEHLVSDFSGTLAKDGRLPDGIRDRLTEIASVLRVHVVSSDTFGTAASELRDLDLSVHLLSGTEHDRQKDDYVRALGPQAVIAIGNGNNDQRMLKTARIGIAVLESEGCAVHASAGADILVRCSKEALDLILHPDRLRATLRW